MTQCPQCAQQNNSDGRFCIFCGATLAVGEQPDPSGGFAESALEGDVATQLRSLQAQVRRAQAELIVMGDRLEVLERSLNLGASPVQSVPISPPTVTQGEGQPPSPGSSGAVGPRPFSSWDWEGILGGNWLARIGVVALVVGVGFFLKLAFDNEWIGETGRVVLGIAGGIALLGTGEFWQRKYPLWAQALTGGGIAILYLSFYAAFSFYQLIDTLPTFGLMFLVTLAAAALALRYEAMAIAVLGIIGGFATPLLLQGGSSDQLLLILYVLVLDLGVLALATFRSWRWFTLLALAGSAVLYAFWYGQFGDEASILVSQGSISLIFLMFVGATSLFHLVWRRRAENQDYALILLNASLYFSVSYGILWDDYREWMGAFTLLLALFYGLVTYGALERGREQASLALFLSGIALVLITIAIPVQLQGPWITLGWAAEATALMAISLRLGVWQLRVSSLAVLAAMVVRLLAVETQVEPESFRLFFNQRVLAFVGGVGAFYLVANLLWRHPQVLREWEAHLFPALLAVASLLTLWLLSAEAISHFEPRVRPDQELGNAQGLSLSVIWAIYGSIALTVGVWRRWTWVRLGGLALLGVVVLKVFLVDSFALEQGYRVAAYMSLGLLLLIGGLLYQRYGRAIRSSLLEE